MASIDIDRISREARQVQFTRVLLTVIATLFYVLGWLAAMVFVVLWRSAAWSFTAMRIGWQDALRRGMSGPAR